MPREMLVDGIAINDDSDCYVIAEIGHNHQGDVGKARELILAAKEAGADAVKLQKRDNRTLYTREMFNKPYENENSFGDTYGAHREFLEFGKKEYGELQQYAKELGVTFFAAAFDARSADFLADLDVSAYKIASGDIRSTPLLAHIAKINKPIIMSTGTADMEDVVRAYETVMAINPRLCILQCTASYPVDFEDMNLNVITTYRERFPNTVIGLSAHDNGIAMPLAAYMLGGRVVEKHFTLNRAMKGTDHAFSLEPGGLRKMIRDLKRARVALGDGAKRCLESEKPALKKMGKSLYAARDLGSGNVFAREDAVLKSPGGSLPPYELDQLVGRKLKTDIPEDAPLTSECFEA